MSRRRHRWSAHLAAAWAIVFAAPHVYWATGRTDGLGTALSNSIVADAGTGMALACAGIALFCLGGAAVAEASVQPFAARPAARRVLVALLWFGAVLLIARCVDIFVEFNLALTGVWHVPAADRDNYLHLARWFMFGYLPWFTVGAIAWTRTAWRFTVGARGSTVCEPGSSAVPAHP